MNNHKTIYQLLISQDPQKEKLRNSCYISISKKKIYVHKKSIIQFSDIT